GCRSARSVAALLGCRVGASRARRIGGKSVAAWGGDAMTERRGGETVQRGGTGTTMKRRGILTAAGAVVAGILAKQTSVPVAAVTNVVLGGDGFTNVTTPPTTPRNNGEPPPLCPPPALGGLPPTTTLHTFGRPHP